MSDSLRKISTISRLKAFLMLRNMNLMAMPIFAIAFVLIFKSVIPKNAMGGNVHPYLLSFGLLFSIVMGGIMMACYPLAEEKEKNTLRVLMTSSVTAREFFIGSLIPTFIFTMVINFILIPISGSAFNAAQLLAFVIVTAITTLTSLVIGLIVGLFSKTQMQAGLNCMPVAFILMFAPILGQMMPNLAKITAYLYSGVLMNFIYAVADKGYQINWRDSLVVLIWLGVSSGLFLLAFKRRGFSS